MVISLSGLILTFELNANGGVRLICSCTRVFISDMGGSIEAQ